MQVPQELPSPLRQRGAEREAAAAELWVGKHVRSILPRREKSVVDQMCTD
jgi:hypothetical protein